MISALGQTRPFVPGMLETAVKNITRAMQKHGIRRLTSTGGTVVRDPQDQPGLVDSLSSRHQWSATNFFIDCFMSNEPDLYALI
ncbi:MAG: hypothetical protein NTW32_18035 [Chloroflexi bacterium]|nr:hypothetical protein [Chloroflexota bacterium]